MVSYGKIICVVAVALFVACFHRTDARPYRTLSRQKRISDQRLAELETLIALSKMKNKMVTIPVGFGRVDPLKIGRRKRSVEELLKILLDASEEDREDEMASEESEKRVGDTVDDMGNEWVYDNSQKIGRYRHLPVRLPK